jgi:hypothetical protein
VGCGHEVNVVLDIAPNMEEGESLVSTYDQTTGRILLATEVQS